MKKVLVTGADGFIGSHLTESLLEKGMMSKHLYIIIHLITGVGLIHCQRKN